MKSTDVRSAFVSRRWKQIAVSGTVVVATSPHGVRHTFVVEDECVRELRAEWSTYERRMKHPPGEPLPREAFLRSLPLMRGREDIERPAALDVLMREAEQDDLFRAAR
jgi:hypothetical protein